MLNATVWKNYLDQIPISKANKVRSSWDQKSKLLKGLLSKLPKDVRKPQGNKNGPHKSEILEKRHLKCTLGNRHRHLPQKGGSKTFAKIRPKDSITTYVDITYPHDHRYTFSISLRGWRTEDCHSLHPGQACNDNGRNNQETLTL